MSLSDTVCHLLFDTVCHLLFDTVCHLLSDTVCHLLFDTVYHLLFDREGHLHAEYHSVLPVATKAVPDIRSPLFDQNSSQAAKM